MKILQHSEQADLLPYDIAYFSAKPLMRYKNDKISVAGELDDIEYLVRMLLILQESKKRCSFFHQYASRKKFNNCMHTNGCTVLHFTVHGSERGENELVIEHEKKYGLPATMKVDDMLISFRNCMPKLVVVLSKHAEKIQKFFTKCGVPHVIGLRYEYQSKDQAILGFQKKLYLNLLNGLPVDKAFESAYLDTKNMLGVMRWKPSKFFLNGAAESHSEVIFPRLPEGQLMNFTKSSGQYRIPLPVHNFVGRNHSLYDLIEKILHPRRPKITWVHGVEGFGKTGLVTMAAHYLKEREILKKILYVDVATFSERDIAVSIGKEMRRTGPQVEEEMYANMSELEFLMQCHEYHQTTTRLGDPWCDVNCKITNITMLAEALNRIKEEVLLILDSVSRVTSMKETLKFCERLTNKCLHVRLLVVTRTFSYEILQGEIRMNRIGGHMKGIQTHEMKPMAEHAALRLLLHTRQPEAIHNEFGNVNCKDVENNVARHPCGILAMRYHVPLAVKRIAEVLDRSNLSFKAVTPNHLESIVRVVLPFNVYLQPETASYRGDPETFRRNELLACSQLDHYGMELLKQMQIRLKRYKKKYSRHLDRATSTRGNPWIDDFSMSSFSTMRSAHSIRSQNSIQSEHSLRSFQQLNSAPPITPVSKKKFLSSPEDGTPDDFTSEESESEEDPDVDFVRFRTDASQSQFSRMPSRSSQAQSSNVSSITVQPVQQKPDEEILPHPSLWSCQQVADWLGALGSKYEQWKILIINNSVDGEVMDVILTDEEMLKELGIGLRINRRIIMQKVKQLFEEFEK